jgi:phospholipase C
MAMTPLTMNDSARSTTPVKPRQPLAVTTSVSSQPVVAPARSVHHQPYAFAIVKSDDSVVELRLGNPAPEALQVSVHSHHLVDLAPERQDLMPGQAMSVEVPTASGVYDIAVHGPENFLRTLAGDMASTMAGLEASVTISGSAAAPGLRLNLRNADRVTRVFTVTNRIGSSTTHRIAPDGSFDVRFQPLKHDDGWYDFTVTVEGVSSFSRRFAGHLQAGRPLAAG